MSSSFKDVIYYLSALDHQNRIFNEPKVWADSFLKIPRKLSQVLMVPKFLKEVGGLEESSKSETWGFEGLC